MLMYGIYCMHHNRRIKFIITFFSRKDESSGNEEEAANSFISFGADETLIFDDSIQGYKIAPCESKKPTPMTIDIRAEELSFPSIYCGQKRSLKIKLSYIDIAKSEIRRYDRRACKPTKVLYMFKKLFNEKFRDALQVCLRKHQSSSILTAEQARNPQFLRSSNNRDEGYAVFQNVRSSLSYWK